MSNSIYPYVKEVKETKDIEEVILLLQSKSWIVISIIYTPYPEKTFVLAKVC